MEEKITSIAIVLAAGRGKRMQSKTAKQYLLLQGKPVLYYSLKTFQDSGIDHIILVTGSGEGEYVRREIVEKYGFTKVCSIVDGGKERYHSVYNGLQQARKYASSQCYVLPSKLLMKHNMRQIRPKEVMYGRFRPLKCLIGH